MGADAVAIGSTRFSSSIKIVALQFLAQWRQLNDQGSVEHLARAAFLLAFQGMLVMGRERVGALSLVARSSRVRTRKGISENSKVGKRLVGSLFRYVNSTPPPPLICAINIVINQVR